MALSITFDAPATTVGTTLQTRAWAITFDGSTTQFATNTGLATSSTIFGGPPGQTGEVGLTWRGAWDGGTAYAVRDAVTYNGSSYRRLVAGTTATAPDADATNWALFAQKGDPGAQGDPGPQGPKGLVWRGAWNGATAYAVDDAVSYGGASYRRLVAGTTGTAPDADGTNWAVLAAKGDQGPTGASGAAYVVLLNAGQGAGDVPGGTPVGAIVFRKV